MSGIRYTSRSRRFPMRTQPPPMFIVDEPRRGFHAYQTHPYATGRNFYYNDPVIYRTNPYYDQPPRRIYNPVVNRQQIVYQRQPSQIRSRSSSRRQQQRRRLDQQQQQAHTRRPRTRRLNDFMPTEFRNVSPSLPATFNLVTTVTPPSTTALPIVANSTPVTPGNLTGDTSSQQILSPNTTQPFVVNNQEVVTPQQQLPLSQQRQHQQQQEQSKKTRLITPFSRRLQRRNLSPAERTVRTSNRFALLSEDNDEVDVVSIVDEDADESSSTMVTNNRRRKKKKKKNNNNNNSSSKSPKVPVYLEYNRLMTWLRNNGKAKEIESSSGNHAFVVHSLPVYDRWIRDHYEVQVWQQYLELGINEQYWTKEVVERTKVQDNVTNRKFVSKKINALSSKLAQTNVTIINLRNRLGTYWSQVPRLVPSSELANQLDTATEAVASSARTATTSSSMPKSAKGQPMATYTNLGPDRIRKKIIENETTVLDYLFDSTRHIRQRAELRIQLAKAQWNECRALENFQRVAMPDHYSIHEIIKRKMVVWSTKYKKRQLLNKRLELDLPPKFIERIRFQFPLDESILNRREAQEFYDQMHVLTERYRTEALRIYQDVAMREFDLVSIEVRQLLDSLHQTTHEDEDSATAFRQYHQLHEKRLIVEAEQSVQFLYEQCAEYEHHDDSFKSVETIVPTSAQVLREDFVIQS